MQFLYSKMFFKKNKSDNWFSGNKSTISMCALMKKKNSLYTLYCFCIWSFISCTKYMKLNSENMNLSELFLCSFFGVKHNRNLYTSYENLCFDLKTLFRECQCEFWYIMKKKQNKGLQGDKREGWGKCEAVVFLFS